MSASWLCPRCSYDAGKIGGTRWMLMVWSHSSDRHLWAVHWVLSLLGCLGTHHPNLLSACPWCYYAHFTGKGNRPDCGGECLDATRAQEIGSRLIPSSELLLLRSEWVQVLTLPRGCRAVSCSTSPGSLGPPLPWSLAEGGRPPSPPQSPADPGTGPSVILPKGNP